MAILLFAVGSCRSGCATIRNRRFRLAPWQEFRIAAYADRPEIEPAPP